MYVKGVIVSFILSQTPWILMGLIGSMPALTNPFVMISVAMVVLPGLAFYLYRALPATVERSDGRILKRSLFYYMCCAFCWSCTIDLILGLEATGVIHGYMDFYLKKGEEYLGAPFGIAANFWDAFVHMGLYLIIIYKYDNHQNFRDWGIYWNGSMFASMICLLLGAIVGSYGNVLHLAIFLNIPWAVLPIYSNVYLLRNFPASKEKSNIEKPHELSLLGFFILVGMVLSITYGVLRAFVALESPLQFVQYYATEFEPYILEPSKFGLVYILALAFYGIPIQIIAIYGLWNGNQPWIKDWSLLFAGFTAQGTFLQLAAQLHPAIEETYRPTENVSTVVFLNLFVAFIAHLWAYYCCKQEKNKLE